MGTERDRGTAADARRAVARRCPLGRLYRAVAQ